MKLCECGCGSPAPISKWADNRGGYVKGEPKRFIHNHHSKIQARGEDSWKWKGGTYKSWGRRFIFMPNHPKALKKYIRYSRYLAEKVLGKYLPEGAIVHHANGDDRDDRCDNYVICESRAYHALLHQRKRAYEECGHVNWRKCRYCKKYDDPRNLYFWHGQNAGEHKLCKSAYAKKRYWHKKLEGK